MDRLDVSYQTFTRHFRAAPFATQAKSFVALELGPSGSLLTAPIASAFGAAEVVLVDLTHAPSQILVTCRKVAQYLADRGHDGSRLKGLQSVGELLSRCSARYLTEGLVSLRGVADASVDFLFSHECFRMFVGPSFSTSFGKHDDFYGPTGWLLTRWR